MDVRTETGAVRAHLIRLDSGHFESQHGEASKIISVERHYSMAIAGEVNVTVDPQLDAQLNIGLGITVEVGYACMLKHHVMLGMPAGKLGPSGARRGAR